MPNRRALRLGAVIATVLVIAGAGIAYALSARQEPPVRRLPLPLPPPIVTSESPAPLPGSDITGPLDLLLIGVDTRASIPDWEPHADAIMLLHVEPDLKSGYLTSLPRDLRVDMPAFKPAGFPGGRYKITEAMSRGAKVPGGGRPKPEQGYALLRSVISRYTGIKRFQAGAVLTFQGLSRLTDALGGVTLRVDRKVVSQHRRPDGTLRTLRRGGGGYVGPQATYLPGVRKLAGWQALDYARQRYGLPNGDYDRQRHQRQLVTALLNQAVGDGVPNNPARLNRVLTALGDTLVFAGDRNLIDYVYALSGLAPSAVTMVGLPGDSVLSGGGYVGEQLKPIGRQYFQAVVRGRAAAFVAAHPELTR